MQFKNIHGHEGIKSNLVNSVKTNRISHAQLFLGPEGNGGLALALAYAQYINCHDKNESDSCGECASCRKIAKLIHPDLHFSFPFFAKNKNETSSTYLEEWRKALLENPYMDLGTWRSYLAADNKQANINIAEAHSIIKKLSLKAFEAEYKTLILWLPEYLDQEGNALLKLIEEPPAKTLFLLVAENSERILNTILSRTQLIKIPAYSPLEINSFLVSNLSVEETKSNEISLIADGNMQKALVALDEKEDSFFNTFIEWMRHVVTDSGQKFIQQTEETFPRLGRENQKSFLIYALHLLRQAVLVKQNLAQLVHLGSEEQSFVEKFANSYSLQQMESAITLLEQAHYNIERNANAKILFLDLSLQLVLIFKYQTFPKGTQYI